MACPRPPSTGAKVTKTYHPALTPYQRLQQGWPELLTTHDRRDLDHQLDTLNPPELRRTVADLQGNLIELARRRGPVPQRPNRHGVYSSKRKISAPCTRAS
ncbi:hypothetical protein GCM10027418_18350 [Mariniluteicoccus endophyticus]